MDPFQVDWDTGIAVTNWRQYYNHGSAWRGFLILIGQLHRSPLELTNRKI